MRVGYIRVSTEHQHTDRQEDKLAEMNVEKIFLEKASGKNRNRPQLKAMMEFVQPGDVVVVEELSRLARSVMDLYDIAKQLNDKGVSLESLKEDIDMSSATGKLTFGIMAVMAQFERDLLLERQKEGIRAAKVRGKKWGAEIKYGTDKRQLHEIFTKYMNKKIGLQDAMKTLGMKKSTFYYRYNKWYTEQEDEGLIHKSE